MHLRARNRALAAEEVLLKAAGRRILIVADDLSGAADCAAAFARQGRRVVVLLDSTAPRVRADVLAIDLDTRRRSERSAASTVSAALRRHAGSATLVYKKIDSTLRGHVLAELAAARAELPGRAALLAPAFPAQGRIVRRGRVLVRGKPLSATVPGLLDAESNADLDRIAHAALLQRPIPLCVGSAGLAYAIARQLHASGRDREPRRRRRGGGLIAVVGSRAPIAREQADELATLRGIVRIELPAANLLAGARSAALRAAGATLDRTLAAGHDAVVSLESGDAGVPGDRLARALGRFVARYGRAARTWLLTGGDTARGALGALGVSALAITGEIEPGVPVSRPVGSRNALTVCTKAGGFGDSKTLVRCRAALRRRK